MTDDARGPARPSAPRLAEVKRELLVRQLENWAPAALHRGRRATYVHGYADAGDGLAAEAALRVFVEQSDLVRGRELTMLAVADDVAVPARRLAAVQREAGPSAGLAVHTIAGGTDARLAVAVTAAGAARAPLLGYLDAAVAEQPPALGTVAALAAGKPAEVLLVLGAGTLPSLVDDRAPATMGDRLFGDEHWRAIRTEPAEHRVARLVAAYRTALHRVGFPLTAAVELVAGADDADGELLVFGTTSGRSLEAFKEALWAVDEFAGVRYRDPGDVQRHLIDISLRPHPGPLRRELLAHLATVGRATVTELRTFAMTETVYRAADASRALSMLVAVGAVSRTPATGRLGGDVVIAAEPGSATADPAAVDPAAANRGSGDPSSADSGSADPAVSS